MLRPPGFLQIGDVRLQNAPGLAALQSQPSAAVFGLTQTQDQIAIRRKCAQASP